MILIDSRVGSKELQPLIRQMGVLTELMTLEFADAAFEGNGPKGPMPIAIERKALHDMLQCIDDARFAGHQLPGMWNMYKGGKLYLIIEGEWCPHNPGGFLMECRNGQWFQCRPGGRPIMYHKLYRYLLSVANTGVNITYTKDLWHTAFNICELYHYYQKKWADHGAMMEMHREPIPPIAGEPSLVRKWAAAIKNIGSGKMGIRVAQKFKTPYALAAADEQDWLTIPGIGVEQAQKIVKEIRGWK
jgi:ERCC4-type nuclease